MTTKEKLKEVLAEERIIFNEDAKRLFESLLTKLIKDVSDGEMYRQLEGKEIIKTEDGRWVAKPKR